MVGHAIARPPRSRRKDVRHSTAKCPDRSRAILRGFCGRRPFLSSDISDIPPENGQTDAPNLSVRRRCPHGFLQAPDLSSSGRRAGCMAAPGVESGVFDVGSPSWRVVRLVERRSTPRKERRTGISAGVQRGPISGGDKGCKHVRAMIASGPIEGPQSGFRERRLPGAGRRCGRCSGAGCDLKAEVPLGAPRWERHSDRG